MQPALAASSFGIVIPPNSLSYFFRNITESHALAWYKPVFMGQVSPVAVATRINNWLIAYGPRFFNLSGVDTSSNGAVLANLMAGRLQISQWGAGQLIQYAYDNGIIPQSFFVYWLRPLVQMGAVVLAAWGISAAAASLAGASSAGAGAGAGAGTTVLPASTLPGLAPLSPISTAGFAPIAAGGLTAVPFTATLATGGGTLAGTLGGVLSTAGTVAGTAGTVLKTASVLQALKGGAQPQAPSTPVTPPAPTGKKPNTLLILGALGAGAFALLHFI